MEVIIREATIEDVSKILEIINFEILHTTVVYDYKERSYDQQLQWFLNKQKDNLPIIVAEKDNDVIGFGTFGIYRPWEAYKYAVEHSIYVDRNIRGVGTGKLLLTQLIAIAKEQGYHTMIAGIDAANDKSVTFHKKFGFKEVGTLKEVGYKFDTWLDLVFLQLILT